MKFRDLGIRRWGRSALAAVASSQLELFPIAGQVRGYDRARFNRDGIAGLQVALLAVPQGLAFAAIAGLPPEHGIYASIAGLVLGAVFSGNRHVMLGPSVTLAVLLLSTFVRLKVSPDERAEVVAVLLVLTGLILIIGAWFRLAALTRYVSRSVTIGFVAAGGMLIFASQLKHVLGLPLRETGVFLQDLRMAAVTLTDTHWPSLLVASVTAGAYLVSNLRLRTAPAATIAVALGSLTGWLLARGGFPTATLAVQDERLIPEQVSGLQLEWIGVTASAALAAALLAQLESSLVGRSFAARAGERFDANQSMFGLGIANLGNAFFLGLPVSASLSRTRLAWRQGAMTPASGVLAALYAAALFAGVGPLLHLVPRPALSALAMMLATEIVSRHYLQVIVRSTTADAFVLVATIAAGLLFRLDIAIYFGAGLSIVFFLQRVGVPQLSEYRFTDEGQLAMLEPSQERERPDISIVHVEGDLFFGAAEIFLEQARRMWEDPNLKVIVLRMKNAHHLDATCALAIEELLRSAREKGRHIIVSGAHREIFRVFRNSGLLQTLGRENFFMDVPSNPTISTRNALKRAQELLGGREANIRIYVDPAKKAAAPATPA